MGLLEYGVAGHTFRKGDTAFYMHVCASQPANEDHTIALFAVLETLGRSWLSSGVKALYPSVRVFLSSGRQEDSPVLLGSPSEGHFFFFLLEWKRAPALRLSPSAIRSSVCLSVFLDEIVLSGCVFSSTPSFSVQQEPDAVDSPT